MGEKEAGLGGCPMWVSDCVCWPQSTLSPPEAWASSRRLRSVSRRASVRSRWLMRAVSTGGHEGREAGLSESCARQGRTGECVSGGRGAPGLPDHQVPGGHGGLWWPVWPGLTCTFWPAISVGLGGRGGGCRSPSLVTYWSRLTSRAQESAQLCTCIALLEQRSSKSGRLCGVGGGRQPGL